MIYKAKGDGLQREAIFQKGYTYQIFMYNNPVSKTYLSKRPSLLDDRVMSLFDTVEGKHNQLPMDNLYKLDAYSRQCTIMRKKY